MVDKRFFPKKKSHTLAQLSSLCGADVFKGDPQQIIESVAPLGAATRQDISFLDNIKYLSALSTSKAGACVLASHHLERAPPGMALLISNAPYRAFAQIAAAFYPRPPLVPRIDPSAFIHPTAQIGEGCALEAGVVIHEKAIIGPGCSIGVHTQIGAASILGEGCRIEGHVTLTYAILGKNVHIKAGARIGQQGFGFFMEEQEAQKAHYSMPQLGRVIIGDCVEIGAGTTIDRGSLNDTIIGDWARIDNLVQIAHNVEIGKGCVIAGQVGIAGSTKIGDFSALGGQVGVSGHLSLAPGSRIAAKSGVMRDTRPNETVAGIPGVPISQWRRQCLILKNLSKKDKS